ncbi:MAG: Calx-beta domain-containing protein [Planctomycetia bacterium]
MFAAVPPTISVADISVVEEDGGRPFAVFTLTLSERSRRSVTVRYATADGTATAGADYVAKSGTVTFAAGVTSRTVRIPLLPDRTHEGNETFRLTLSAPRRATLTGGAALATIVEDDPAPTPPTPPVPPTPPAPPTPGPRVFAVNPAAADIVGFNPAVDQLDFGTVSVHNLIVAKTAGGEVAIVNPWAWTPEEQVLRGIRFTDLTAGNFGIVQNEHLRQDIGGVLSWERGVGPRVPGTVYVRSHESGVREVVSNFDPATNKLSFLYFGTRERLSVTDTPQGLLIAVEPTGQSVLLEGVRKADLVPANVEFHHDQVVEDQLEVPFGFTVEQVTLASRADLLTPTAPAGQVTDGHQTSPGGGDAACHCGTTPCSCGHDHGTPVPPAPSPPPDAGAATGVAYRQVSSWSGGFSGEVTVVNAGATAATGWRA